MTAERGTRADEEASGDAGASSRAWAWFRWLVRRRRWVMGVWLLWLLACGAGVARLQQDFSVESYFPRDDAARQLYEEFKGVFPREDGQVAALWTFGEPLSAQGFALLRRTAEALEREGLRDVIWIGSAERSVWDAARQGWGRAPLVPREPSDAELGQVLEQHADDALYQGLLWDEQARTFVVSGLLPRERNTVEGRAELESGLQARLAGLDARGAELELSGLPVIRAKYLRLLQADQAVFLGSGMLLCFALLYWFFRSVRQVCISLLAIAPAYLATLAVLAFVGRPLTALTAIVPLLLLVIGLSDGVHVLTTYRHHCREGLEREAAIVRTFGELWRPCFFTSLTTAIGFLCLLSTGIDIVMDFAVVAAAGVLLTYAASMSFVPAFLAMGRDSGARSSVIHRPWMEGLLARASLLSERRSRAIVVGTVVVALGSVVLATGLEVDVKMIDEREGHPIVEEIQRVEAHGFGVFQLNLFLRGQGEPLLSRELLEWMSGYEAELGSHPAALGHLSLESWAAAPGSSAEAVVAALQAKDSELQAKNAQLQGNDAEQTAKDGEIGAARAVYDPDSNSAQVVTFVKDAGSVQMASLLDRARQYLREHPPPGVQADLTGTVVLSQLTFERLVGGFGRSLLWAVVAIGLVLWWELRSLAVALLALVPNLLPVAVVLAGLAVTGWPLTPAVVLVFTVAFGIAVDDTIHFLGEVAEQRRAGSDWSHAARAAYRDRGRAIVITSIVVVGGFGVLVLSTFQATFLLGALTAVTLLVALVADLLVLPALLHSLPKRSPCAALSGAS